jgi:hypothetical protein
VIAFGAVERAKFKSPRPRPDMPKRHARSAFRAAEVLNCKQRDCGWVIGHCIPPESGGSATLSVTGRSRRGAVMRSVDSPHVRESTLETLIRRATSTTMRPANRVTARTGNHGFAFRFLQGIADRTRTIEARFRPMFGRSATIATVFPEAEIAP